MTIAATAATLASDLSDAQTQVQTIRNNLSASAVTSQEPLTATQAQAIDAIRHQADTLARVLGEELRRANDIVANAGAISF